MLDTTTGTALWQWLDGRDTARMNRYRTYLAFYEGDQWDDRRRAGERRLTVNYARALVRKSASYLMPRPVTFDVEEAPSLALPRNRGRDQDKNAETIAARLLHPSLGFEGGGAPAERVAGGSLPMQDAYVLDKWKLFGLLLLSALFGVVVGRKGPDLRRSR